MFLNSSTSTMVDGTGYTLEYTVTENQEEEEPGGITEYGIRCVLLDGESTVSEEEIRGISPNYEFVCKMLHKLIGNQVFPVHIKDIISDLLVAEYEVECNYVF